MNPQKQSRQGSERLVAVLVVAGVLIGLVIPDMARMSWLIGETRMLAMVAGGCVGALFAHLLILQRRLQVLEKRLARGKDDEGGPSERSIDADSV